ncbi:hypothetical protein PSU4_10530 [Pseudonocardia sulfidoxydans NBRC 16205]|uniref:DUF4440 domain-containing protein n=2 Tax=Pseudonocardia sulfidoxydans TaxID=54011 RepID=A0A511DBC2_9PSEU|nr:SgcJ/EcaC family oxidoreductase [Pseudonocardia sulfidoxydans]GEL22099.1 hypothetical protein PSU4_10530 [Pseudonocardia sulfidoxydans NBRC 16205]
MSAARPTTASPATDAELTAVLTRLAAAWTAADAPGYGAEFTDDATYVVFNGMVLRGRAAIADTHAWLWKGPLAGSRMDPPRPEDLTVRMLRPDVAHVVVEAGGVALDGQETAGADRASTVSFVFVRDDDAWRIAAFQNTRRTS